MLLLSLAASCPMISLAAALPFVFGDNLSSRAPTCRKIVYLRSTGEPCRTCYCHAQIVSGCAPRLPQEEFLTAHSLCSLQRCACLQLSVQHINATFPALPNGTYPRRAGVRNIDMCVLHPRRLL